MGAAQLDEGFGAVAEGTGGIHHIIHQHYGLAVNIADDILTRDIGAGTALINDGQGAIQPLGKLTRTGDGAQIGGNDGDLLAGEVLELFDKIGGPEWGCPSGDPPGY